VKIVVPVPKVDEIYKRELLTIIQRKIDEHPRSAQIQVGPSEIGGCEVKLAWKLTYGGDSEREGGWAAHKGTLLHGWLDTDVFGVRLPEALADGPSFMPDGTQRWFSDLKLAPIVKWVNGGTLDLYDKLYETVIDWKAPGDWTMKNVRNGKLSEGYYVQAMVYGLGLEEAGHRVSRVSLMFLPMCGDELHGSARGAVFRYWDYDREVAMAALDNVRRIKSMVDVVGLQKVMEVLPRKSDFCSSCPAFIGNNDRRAICPGAEVSRPIKAVDPANPFG
jgi:hypothetical protein